MSTTLSVAPVRVRAGALPLLMAALSTVYAVLGAYWAFGGGHYPFGPVPPDGERLDLMSLLPQQLGATVVAVLGAIGVPAALATRRTGWSPGAYRPLLATTIVQAVVFGLVCADISILILAGYGLVLLGVPAFLLLLVVGALRSPATRLLLAAVVAVLAVLTFGLDVLSGPAFHEMRDGIASMPEKLGIRPVLVFGAFVLGAGWAVLGVGVFRSARERCVRCGRPGAWWTSPERARRWGFRATIVAALCPMPYALVRFSWLLPTPIGINADELDAEPGIRLMGLGLGTIAFCAGLVTLGLIRPWGEIWPRWVPVLAGRPVPVLAAVIPGTIASLLLLVGSPGLFTMLSSADEWWITLFLPFPIWGTAVGLATAAYYFRRRTRCITCHQV